MFTALNFYPKNIKVKITVENDNGTSYFYYKTMPANITIKGIYELLESDLEKKINIYLFTMLYPEDRTVDKPYYYTDDIVSKGFTIKFVS